MDKNAIVQLGKNLALGNFSQTDIETQFSNQNPEEVLRNALQDLTTYMNAETGVINRKAFRRDKVAIFEILESIVQETVNSGLQDRFGEFVEYRNLAWGDSEKFLVPVSDLYRVSNITDGNGFIRRQTIREGTDFTIDLQTFGVKIMEEFHRFLTGRADWATQMKLIGDSFVDQLQNRIYKTLVNTYGSYSATYHKTGALTDQEIIEMAMHLKVRTGDEVGIYGTKLALSKLKPEYISDAMNGQRNELGYFGVVAGLKLHEIEQAHVRNEATGAEDDFIIDNDMLLLLPEAKDRLIKIVNEGEAIIQDQAGGTTADMVQEYFIAQKFGVAVVSSKAFGFIKLA